MCACYSQISSAQAFPYPQIPQELRTPQERGSYLLAHYWDNYDFADTTLIHQPDITEQGFVNFLDMLPRIDSLAMANGVEQFVWRAYAPNVPLSVRNNFTELTEHYLYDPNSPMRSDELYALFLERMASSPAFSREEREHFCFQLKAISKNRPGTIATDFAYIDRKGNASTLYQTEGQLIMLYFNDPDCDNCHAVTAKFKANSIIANNPNLTVLAVYPDADTALWRDNQQDFPSSWIDVYSPDGEISEKQLYLIRATPTIYLLDSNKKVLLNDPTPDMLIEYLNGLKSKI